MKVVSENSPEPAYDGQLTGHAAQADGQALAQAAAAVADPEAGSDPGRPPALLDDLCRLTVCGPARLVELAVPVHVPLIDLLPALVGHLGDGLADAGLEHGGWVLQRLGDPPLREELSISALGLHDGDVVHLRPRADQLPSADFDDLIDGIAVGISGRADRWRPAMSRRLLIGLLAVPLAVGLVVVAGHLGPLSDLCAAAMTAVLLAMTAVASRAFAEPVAAAILGGAAIAYAAAAGAEFPLLHGGPGGHVLLTWSALRPGLLAGGVAMAGASIAVTMLIGGRHPALVGTTVSTVLLAIGGAIATFGGTSPAAAAGVLVAVTVPLGGWIPVLAFRLARLRLDPTPVTSDELQEDLDPIPGQHILERTRWADRYMSALHGGVAVVASPGLIVLALAGGWPAHVVAIDAIVLLLLQARSLVSARHRLATMIPAICGATVLVTVAGLRADDRHWLALLAGIVLTSWLILIAVRSLPGHKLLPHWGRAGDILQSLAAVGLIPAALWLTGLFHMARTVRG
ncbi:MAG TPA: type VII secretion integral membrane protein EccD [Streptosporangiaceae bacterium]|nr:type VII secretion integral membrane protein EccD [Streptosporangiaceae bacterium]